jgi:hypothetical protein
MQLDTRFRAAPRTDALLFACCTRLLSRRQTTGMDEAGQRDGRGLRPLVLVLGAAAVGIAVPLPLPSFA